MRANIHLENMHVNICFLRFNIFVTIVLKQHNKLLRSFCASFVSSYFYDVHMQIINQGTHNAKQHTILNNMLDCTT